jgi:YD repeat-containing protein
MIIPLNIFLLFTILPGLVAPSVTAYRKSDREVHGLKGPVKVVTTELAALTEVEGKLAESEHRVSSVDNYDAAGALVLVENYSNGKMAERTTYFDLDGQRASKSESFDPHEVSGGGPGHRGTPDPRYSLKFKYKYDSAGNRIREDFITAWGDVSAYVVTKFDGQGNRIERVAYTDDGQWLNKTYYTYDPKGNLIEETLDKVSVRSYWDYQFDAKGNWISRQYKYVWSIGKASTRQGVEYRKIAYF